MESVWVSSLTEDWRDGDRQVKMEDVLEVRQDGTDRQVELC